VGIAPGGPCKTCNQTFKRNWFPLENPKARVRSHRGNLAREKPLLIDPSQPESDPALFLGFAEEIVFAVDDCVRGTITIEIVGLNSPQHREDRRERFREFKEFFRIRSLLRKQSLTDADPEVAETLISLEQLIRDRLRPESEYSAMCNAYHRQAGL
jgi:hypothetical protein